ncbi:MAG: hypothetical protein KKC46_06305 [Proteobacteria bacterium]|nr:hypothetical protein [Pseudomonadota bacterium]
MTGKNVNIVIKSVLLLTLLSFLAVSNSAWSYNKSWDQGHKCVNPSGGNNGWGKYNNEGVFHGEYTSKECCELFCKVCPVYANTGRYQKTFTDLMLAGNGPSLKITRTYNSQEWTSSLLGYSWALNFGRKLIITRNKHNEKIIGVLLQTGEKNFYKEDDNGTLTRLTKYGANYDLIKNGDNTYTINEKNGLKYELRIDGKINKIVDRNDNELNFSYNSVGCLSRITNASGNYVDFQLGPNGKISSISDNFGRSISYAYDQNGNLISVTDPLGNTMQYVYNSNNFLTQIIDARGNTIETVGYDTHEPPRVSTFKEKGETYTVTYFDNRTEKKDSHGNKWTYYFNDVGVIQSVVDPLGNTKQLQLNKITATSVDWEEDFNGNRTTYTYDAEGNIASKTDPLGNTWNYSYVAGTDLVQSETDPLGRITRYEYDSKGNLTTIIRGFGGTLESSTSYVSDEHGNLVSLIDSLGNITSYEYDNSGNLLSEIDPLGHITKYTYDYAGNRLSMIDGNGNTTNFSYDIMGNLLSVKDPLNNVTQYFYDANGNRITILFPDSTEIRFTYDQYDRIIQKTDPIGNIQNFSYDHNDNIISIVDANGLQMTFSYDIFGRKTGKTDPKGSHVSLAYDANGNMISFTDKNGNKTLYSYDANNNLTNKTLSDGVSYFYTYDVLGNLTGKTDPNGSIITFSYDSLNRMISKSYSDGSITNFAYDLIDRKILESNDNSTNTYSYDAAGRLIQTSMNGKNITYTYDARGNKLTTITPENLTISYNYNTANLMTQLQLPDGKGVSYSYDSLNRIIRKDYTNGSYSTYSYYGTGNLQQILNYNADGTIIYNQLNSLNNTGNIVTKTLLAGTTNYFYDNNNQITQIIYPDTSQELFAYDSMGNRLSAINQASLNYNNRNQLISSGEKAFSYDNNGNMRHLSSNNFITNYAYNYENQLISIVPQDGIQSFYKYDVKGKRIEKQINGESIKFIYDGNHLLGEYDSDGNLIRNYFYGERDINPCLLYDYQANILYNIQSDHLGAPHIIKDESDNVVWAASYSAFGMIEISVENITYNFRYPGQYFDSESNLAYNINRFYCSEFGRYITEDPIGLRGGLNSYIYSSNNPINNIDPLGLKVIACKRPFEFGSKWWQRGGAWVFPPRHCYLQFNNNKSDSWGYDDNGVHREINPNKPTKCKEAKGGGNNKNCQDQCIRNNILKYQNGLIPGWAGSDYKFIKHNCCDWVRDSLKRCGMELPFVVNAGF